MDLSGLDSYLRGLGPSFTLSAADTQLPAELRAWLGFIPNQQVHLDVSEDAISGDSTRLTVAGRTTDTWAVEGLSEVQLTLSDFTLNIVNGSTDATIEATATAALPLGAPTPSLVTVASAAPVPWDPPQASTSATTAIPWRITLTQDVSGITPTGLIQLIHPSGPPFFAPPGLDVLTRSLVVARTDFSITFYPGTGAEASYTFSVRDKAFSWEVINGAVAIDGVEVAVAAMTRSLSVTLLADLEIGTVPVQIGVVFATSCQWTAFVRAADGKTFPSVAAIADWIAGSGRSQSSDVTSGFGALKLDLQAFDAAISGISITFDAAQAKLIRMEIDSELTIADVPLRVRLLLPQIAVTGQLKPGHAPVKLSAVLGSLDLPADHLPSDAAIDEVELRAVTATSTYSATLGLADIAKAGPFDLEQLTATVTYSGVDGFSGLLGAVLELWDVAELELQAGYDPQAGWMFEGMTEPGTSLSVGHLITQLAADPFGIKPSEVPQPIQSLAISGLKLGYETASGDFTFTFVGDFELADKPVEIAPAVHIVRIDPTDPTKGYSYHDHGGDDRGRSRVRHRPRLDDARRLTQRSAESRHGRAR